MEQVKTDYKNIDEYILEHPGDAADMLSKLRAIVHEAVPDINEKISWQMPTFYKTSIVIQFAAHQKHVGIYPGSEAIEVFREQISEYKFTKGGFQLPYGTPVPYELMRNLVLFRLAEEERRALEKAKGTKKKGKKMSTISIKGMSCEHCRAAVKEALEEIGLENVEVDLANGTAAFAETNVDMNKISEAISEAGFDIG